MTQPLAVDTVHQGVPHAFTMKLRGALDLATCPLLTARLDELLDQGALVVVVDATDVDFIDSTGLRALVHAGNALTERGGRLFIEGMSGATQRVLEVTGLLERFQRP